MTNSIKSQFKASLQMLENAIRLCPEGYWNTKTNYWYIAYHCLFWTDYYLSQEPNKFQIVEPFTLSEFDPKGQKPERTYSKSELLNYLKHCRSKAIDLFDNINEDQLKRRWINDYKDYSILEIILYNMRHIQHHAAQLNLLLRQTIDQSGAWVSQG